MSKQQLIEAILSAIDAGEPIDVDLRPITDPVLRAQVEALLTIHQAAGRFRSSQHPAPTDVFQANDRWLHLVIHEKIGSGGFGQVYRAYDSMLETDVAVKILNPEKTGIDENAFLKEARLMATVRNPHVLAIHGAGRDQGIAGYWSDYLDGQILCHFLSEGVPDTEQKLEIIQQITQAVKATHNSEVVHGDIKSLNVMLQPSRGAILLDFGSSQSKQHPTDSDYSSASPVAMAPEQFNGEPATSASDVFALGLLFFEILTGRPLLHGTDMSHLQQLSMSAPEQLKKSPMSGDWYRLLTAMLQSNPKARPDVLMVEKCIHAIKTKPLKRARRIAWASFIVLLSAVTVMSLFSNWRIRQANQQTKVINDIYANTFLTVAPYKDGKNVKLTEVLQTAWENIKENKQLESEHQQNLLIQLIGTFLVLSDHDTVMQLADEYLNRLDLSLLNRVKARRYQASVYLHRKEFKSAENIYLDLLEIPTNETAVIDEQMTSLSMLFYVHMQLKDYEKIPPILQKRDELKPLSSNKLDDLARMAYNEGLYFVRLQQPQQAYEAFKKSETYYTQAYHSEHYATLTSAIMGAHALSTISAETSAQGIEEMEKVIPRMEISMGAQHSTTISGKINLAISYNQSGQPHKAVAIYEAMQADVREKFGETSRFVLGSFMPNYVGALLKSERFSEAKELLIDVIQAYRTHHPDDLESHVKAQLDLVVMYQTAKWYPDAKLAVDETVDFCQRQLSDTHRSCLRAQLIQLQTMQLMNEAGVFEQVSELYQQHVTLFGEQDPQSIAVHKYLEELQQPNPADP